MRALVTGASRRVGRAIALELARRGADLVLTARQRGGDLEETVAMVEAVRGAASRTAAEGVALELSDLDDVGRFVRDRAREPWDVVVLSASSYDRSEEEGVDLARAAERHFRVNASSALMIARGFAPALAASSRPGGGAIVAMSDMHVEGRPVRGFAPYLMSKAALSQMVRSLAVELAPRVRVNAVLPGVVAWPDGTDDEVRRAYEARIPLERSGTPEDAAGAVAWLALDAPYVTGVELRIDGGRWLR